MLHFFPFISPPLSPLLGELSMRCGALNMKHGFALNRTKPSRGGKKNNTNGKRRRNPRRIRANESLMMIMVNEFSPHGGRRRPLSSSVGVGSDRNVTLLAGWNHLSTSHARVRTTVYAHCSNNNSNDMAFPLLGCVPNPSWEGRVASREF